jgi:1,2-phenylacetyl-CoA epoxidase PaaB subunit
VVMVYEVFARKSRGDALRHIGNLNAPDDELARVYAFSTYDEERWFDMWVVPRDRLIEVFSQRESDTVRRDAGERAHATGTGGE